MKRTFLASVSILAFLCGCGGTGPPADSRPFALVIHGGAGTITRAEMSKDQERQYREALGRALGDGFAILEAGGSGLDAVEAAIRFMEDSPLFNAGKGAVFTGQGKNEMDAAIMDGSTLEAGAVASVTTIKNPIAAARAVLTGSPHVLLVGRGAEIFAAEQGLEIVAPEYFFTQRRWDALLRAKEKEKNSAPPGREGNGPPGLGTVGAVAMDRDGNLAAGTSTGGLTNKRFGRVGDSPIIGAGTYASNRTCAVSGTGQGEFFMRGLVAYDIAAMMEYAGLSVDAAARRVILEKLTALGGTGGVIALDRAGNQAMVFNTEGMYRGFVGQDGAVHVFIFGDEEP